MKIVFFPYVNYVTNIDRHKTKFNDLVQLSTL
jgi:hypothetical protein